MRAGGFIVTNGIKRDKSFVKLIFTGREICYRYDRLGRRIATRYPDNHELRWRYNESGLVVEQSEWF